MRSETGPLPAPAYGADVRRACLPELLRVEDAALALGLTPSGARRLILRGGLGPYVRVGRRIVLRRESMLDALEAREEQPVAPLAGQPGAPEKWTRRLRKLPPRGEGE